MSRVLGKCNFNIILTRTRGMRTTAFPHVHAKTVKTSRKKKLTKPYSTYGRNFKTLTKEDSLEKKKMLNVIITRATQRPFGRTGLTAVQGYHYQSDMVVRLQRVPVLLFVVVAFRTCYFFLLVFFALFLLLALYLKREVFDKCIAN